MKSTGQENNCLKKENRSLSRQLQICQEAENIALEGLNIPTIDIQIASLPLFRTVFYLELFGYLELKTAFFKFAFKFTFNDLIFKFTKREREERKGKKGEH